jgi:hypothetical protein
LKTSIRDRLVLKERSFSKRSENQDDEIVKKSINQKDNSIQLSTSYESSSSQLISRQSELTDDDRISRLQSEEVGDVVESSNVTVRRKDKRKKLIEFDQSSQSGLSQIDQISLDVIDFQIDMRFTASRDIDSVDLDEVNILDGKRTRKPTSRYSAEKYAQVA